jgi:hypothetical protein
MDQGERQISIQRVSGDAGALYLLSIEGFETILVTADRVSRVLGLIFGEDAAAPFREVVDGPAGSLVAYRPLDVAQLAALNVLLKVPGQLDR